MLNENHVEFYFSVGTVLMNFSFFRTDHDLVCLPPPPNSGFPPPQLCTYFGPYLKNILWPISQKKFGSSKQYKFNEFAYTKKKNMTYCHLQVGDPFNIIIIIIC